MSTPQKRTRLSFLVLSTRRLLLVVLGIFAVMLGAVYLFVNNTLAIKGYALNQELHQGQEIANEMTQLNAEVAKLETREYLGASKESKAMVLRETPQYVVVRDRWTAKK